MVSHLRSVGALSILHSGHCPARTGAFRSTRGIDPFARGVQVGGHPITVSSVALRLVPGRGPLDTVATFDSAIVAGFTRRREVLVDSHLLQKRFHFFIDEGAPVVAFDDQGGAVLGEELAEDAQDGNGSFVLRGGPGQTVSRGLIATMEHGPPLGIDGIGGNPEGIPDRFSVAIRKTASCGFSDRAKRAWGPRCPHPRRGGGKT